MSKSKDRLDIQIYKGTEEIEHKHEGQPEGSYSVRMVFVDMISMPVGNHLI